MFKVFQTFILVVNNTIQFFIIENVLVLFYHAFYNH